MTKLLLQHGADPCAENKKGLTPAHIAAHYGRVGVLKLLIAHDETLLKHKDLTGNTVLHIASCKGHRSACDFLLKQNVNVSARNSDGNTPYHMAVIWKRLHVLKVGLHPEPPITFYAVQQCRHIADFMIFRYLRRAFFCDLGISFLH